MIIEHHLIDPTQGHQISFKNELTAKILYLVAPYGSDLQAFIEDNYNIAETETA